MLQLLFNWTETAPHGVKLCVSSREYNVFPSFFSSDRRLRLQDLTLADMQHYVRDMLQELEKDQLDRLVRSIKEKTSGFFLWVAFLVRAVRTRLEDGFSMSIIDEEINSLLDELEGLFQHLLASISNFYEKGAYETFAMLSIPYKASKRNITGYYHPTLTLLRFSLLDAYNMFDQVITSPCLETGLLVTGSYLRTRQYTLKA